MNISYLRRFSCAALILCGFAAALAVPPSQEIKKAGRLVLRGERALRAGQLDRAWEYFTDAAELVPSFPAAHIGLGHINMQEGRFMDALLEYDKAQKGYSEMGEAFRDIQNRRYANAQKQINALQDSIRQLQTGGPGGGAAMGLANLEISKLENVISRLQAIEPPYDAGEAPAEMDFYIGNAFLRLGRLDEAITAWEKCAEKKPDFGMAFNNLALGYWRKGQTEQALTNLHRAEELGFPVSPQFKTDLEAAAEQ